MGGMRIGSRHSWKYTTGKWKEAKIGPRKWRFTYEQGKRRSGSWAPAGSGMPVGSRLHWGFRNVTQHAVKTGANTYKLIMRGIKYQKGFKLGKGRKKWVTPRKKRRKKRRY